MTFSQATVKHLTIMPGNLVNNTQPNQLGVFYLFGDARSVSFGKGGDFSQVRFVITGYDK